MVMAVQPPHDAASSPPPTAGRPATMTRAAVLQGRVLRSQSQSQQQPEHTDSETNGSDDGWVHVEHRRHRHTRDVAPRPRSSSRSRPRSRSGSISASTGTGAGTHGRADALSAAMTMDKNSRERLYAHAVRAQGKHKKEEMEGTVLSTSPTPQQDEVDVWASSLQRLMEAMHSSDDEHQHPRRYQHQHQHQTPHDQDQDHKYARVRRSRTQVQIQVHDGEFEVETEVESWSQEEALPPPLLGHLRVRRAQSEITPSRSPVRQRSARNRSPAGARSGSRSRRGSHSEAGTDANTNTNTNGQKKCGDKRDFFFRNWEYAVRSQLRIDDVAAFSVTDFEMAKKISEVTRALFAADDGGEQQEQDQEQDLDPGIEETRKSAVVVTDATACVGGNVFSFCDYFEHVNAVECDETRFGMLQHNLAVLHKTNVKCVQASYLKVMMELEQDVVFVDPPWGGPEYKEQSTVDLFLDGVALYEVCERLKEHTQCVVLKVPTNFDVVKFAMHVSGHVKVRKDFKKMHLVILDFRERDANELACRQFP